MQKVIVDCKTGGATYIELSPAEEADHLEETEKNREEERRTSRGEAIQLLAQNLAILREMERQSDIFTVEDIANQQQAVADLHLKITGK